KGRGSIGLPGIIFAASIDSYERDATAGLNVEVRASARRTPGECMGEFGDEVNGFALVTVIVESCVGAAVVGVAGAALETNGLFGDVELHLGQANILSRQDFCQGELEEISLDLLQFANPDDDAFDPVKAGIVGSAQGCLQDRICQRQLMHVCVPLFSPTVGVGHFQGRSGELPATSLEP
ncbi:MAG: hypothetical protein M3132_10460, partial [Actinomycetia bacterium]|nr:hypothetical protein [Actinomycetes bacterium]